MPGMKKPMRKKRILRGGMGMKKKARSMRGGGSMMMKKPVMAKRGKAMRTK